MSRRLTLVAVLLSAALLSSFAHAQNVTARVVMTSDRSEVAVGQAFRLQIRADVTGADIQSFDEPPLAGFTVQARQVSRPVQFRFFGGQQQVIQSTTIHTYTLVAEQPGRYDMQPATVRAGGEEFQSNPITIVVGGSNVPAQPQQQQQDPAQSTNSNIAVDGAQVDPNAFLRTIADVADPYVGQQVSVSVYLYTRAPIRAAPQITREPTADGFWIHDLLPPQRTLNPTTQTIQGTTYRVYLLRRFAAFPLREGELEIGAPEISMSTGSLFDMFNGSQQLERTGVPITIRARALPDPPPNAVVGEYTLEASLDRNQVRTGDAVTLTAVVRGVGNIRDVRFGEPNIEGLQVLQQPSEDTVEQPNDRVGGMRRMSWLFVPQEPGTFTIPPLVLNTFDPETRQYNAVRGPELQIVAAGNAIAPDPADVEPDEQVEDPVQELPPPEFGPVRTSAELRRATPPVSGAPWYFALLAGLPLLAVLGGVFVRQLRKRRDNPKVVPAKRRLDQADKLAASGDARAFYGAVAATLKTAIETKIGEAVGGLTHDALRRDLRHKGMGEEVVRKLIEELEACDFARFSSAGASRDEMDRTLRRARELLSELDRFRPQEAA